MKTLEELEKQIASNWSIKYKGWTMLIIEGRYKDYRYYHQCTRTAQFVTPVIRVCETCKTPMPDEVWEHFLKTQLFISPPKAPRNDYDDAMDRMIKVLKEVKKQ